MEEVMMGHAEACRHKEVNAGIEMGIMLEEPRGRELLPQNREQSLGRVAAGLHLRHLQMVQ